MLINERHNLIILELQKNPDITVREMAKKLNFSELAVLEKVRTIYQAQHRIPCTGCRYCTDGCLAGIDIPGVFALLNDKLEGKEDADARYAALERGPDRCVGCDMCGNVCPQGLNIRHLLAEVDALRRYGGYPGRVEGAIHG